MICNDNIIYCIDYSLQNWLEKCARLIANLKKVVAKGGDKTQTQKISYTLLTTSILTNLIWPNYILT